MPLTTRINWRDGVVYTTGALTYRSRFGTSPTPSGVFSLTDGTGDGAADDVFEDTFSINAATTLEIDLKGGNGELNVANEALNLATVKGVEIILTTTPASGVSIRFGPQGLTNAAQLWFQAATTNFYDIVRDRFAQFDRATGWALDATHKVIGLHNPGAAAVAGWIRVIGVGA